MPEKPRITGRRIVASSHLFKVEELDLQFSNGACRRFERIVGGSAPASVLIIPMLDHDIVLLVREYAAAMDRYELGLPKGLVEQGEDPLHAANREIMEEVGHGARRLRRLTELTLAPAYIEHRTLVILAQDLYPQRIPGDEPEPPEVVPWRLSELDSLLQRTDCTEARTVAALYLTRTLLGEDSGSS
jgi:ADP-ribose diphosphatase